MKYLTIGVGAIAVGAALWYLSRDTEECVTYDPKIHTKEKMHEIVRDIFVENATQYCQKLNLINSKKAAKDFTEETLKKIISVQKTDIDEAEAVILKDHKVSEELMQEWLGKNKDDPYVKKVFEKLQVLYDKVFNFTNPTIDHVVCENMPEGMDQISYIDVYRKS